MRTPALILLMALVAVVHAAVPPGFVPGRMLALEEQLRAHPQDAPLNAEYALGLARTGRCVQAEPHWDLGAELAQSARADCLREQGRARQAAALRELDIHSAPRPLLHYLMQAQDLRVAGDLAAAEAAADQALALQPSGKRVMALYVELALDRGDVERAQALLAVADFHLGLDPSELLLAKARTSAALGEFERADGLVLEAVGRGRQPVQAACLRTRVLLAQGEAPLALAILEQPRFDEREELCVLRARWVVHEALGETERAEEWRILLEGLASGGALDTQAIPMF